MAADPITADVAAELLNYDVSDDDPFNDNPQPQARDDKAMLSPRGTKRKTTDEGGNALGLDEEVKITKKRKPTVKLDEARLLSAPGIPKLREISRSSAGATRKLRMKGKGHEFSDVARLLNFYQLWLDGLYPRAKFADGLQLIEKVGHTKRMQVMRKEWIDEGKPGYIKPGTELVESILNDDFPIPGHVGHNGQPTRTLAETEPQDNNDGMFFPSPSKTGQQAAFGGAAPDDDELDELDLLLAAQEHQTNASAAPSKAGNQSDGEDDMDAIMAEEESRRQLESRAPAQTHTDADNEASDLDALLAEEEARSHGERAPAPAQTASSSRPSSSHSRTKPRKQAIFDDSVSEGEDDLDALLAAQTARQRKSTPPTSPLPANSEATSLPTQEKVTDQTPGSSQEGIAKTFSSSPMRKDSYKDGLGAKTYSSSPLPNPEEADLDALLGDDIM